MVSLPSAAVEATRPHALSRLYSEEPTRPLGVEQLRIVECGEDSRALVVYSPSTEAAVLRIEMPAEPVACLPILNANNQMVFVGLSVDCLYLYYSK